MAAKSCASCGVLPQSIAKPVWRQAMTSLWSPKIESAWVASARAETWSTNGRSSPAILYMFGMYRSRPCEQVNELESEPAWSEPWTAPAAPASDCISITSGTWPQMLVFCLAAHSSQNSPMGEEGVMG